MKRRDSNFEMLRLVAMMLVMLVHANYLSLGNVAQQEILATPWSAAIRVFCEQLCIVSVNLFILISGWFAIRPTLEKLASLLFQVLFIGLISVEVSKLLGAEISSSDLGNLLYLGSCYWFVPSYLILFGISPMLNKFCEHATKREFATLLISFFVLEALFGWLASDFGHFERGYSALSFIGLYLLAQYIRRHGVRLQAMKAWQSLLFYLLFTIIPAAISYVGLLLNNKEYGATMYSSLFVVAASVSLMLIFTKIHFESRVVNWLASSAFAIYLTHQAPGMFELYTDLFKGAYAAMPGFSFVLFTLGATLTIALASILLDKVRMLLWQGVIRLKDLVVPQQ